MAGERIVVVDDQQFMREGLRETLTRAGYAVTSCASGAEALDVLAEGDAAALVTDVRMPEMSGMRLLERVRAADAALPVVMITAYGTVENAVEAMKGGAFDYVLKPFNAETLELVVRKAVEHRRLLRENEFLRDELGRAFAPENFLGESEAMQAIFAQIGQVAGTDSTVLLRGETGTGKELAAAAIHMRSPRADRPLVRVNCAALSAGLLESELFGHEKGAFTGAERQRVGRFELAEDGTILLDEISEMSLALQGKLLRVLQEREYERVGSSETVRTNARILATSNRPLETSIEEGTFRRDLFYRLNVVPITLPPLRERKGDIPLLVEHFLRKHGGARTRADAAGAEGAPEARRLSVTREALAMLEAYDWPGNVRELENIVERAVVLGDGAVLGCEAIAPGLARHAEGAAGAHTRAAFRPRPLAEVEEEHVRRVLEHFDGHRQKSATALGISERSLRDRLKRWRERDA